MRTDLDMLPRPYLKSNGLADSRLMHICECSEVEKRGNKGEVCGRCGDAIPSLVEEKLFKTK